MPAIPTAQSLSQLVSLANYTDLVVAHAATTRDPEAFPRLDRDLFPGRASAAPGSESASDTSGGETSGGETTMTKDRLLDILKWKLLRGKHRPFLPKLVASNPESAIQSAFTAALAALSTTTPTTPTSILAAITALSSPLKGVGPATASAVLATVSEHVPFMSDEIMHLAGIAQPFKYSAKEYARVIEWLDDKIREFAREGLAGHLAEELHPTWTRRSLERAFWAYTVQTRANLVDHSPTLVPGNTTARKPERKANATTNGVNHDADPLSPSPHAEVDGEATEEPTPSKRVRRSAAPKGAEAAGRSSGVKSESSVRKSSRLAAKRKEGHDLQSGVLLAGTHKLQM